MNVRRFTFVLTALTVAALGGAFAPEPPPALVDVLIEGPNVLTPGTHAALRVAAFQSERLGDFKALPDAEIAVTLLATPPVDVYKGLTDARGNANVTFEVPDIKPGDYTLRIVTTAGGKTFTHDQPVKLRRDLKILMVTDKPLYQPGQQIHVRALALVDLTMEAAGEAPILFEIEDSKSNKVLKKEAKTNAFGIASIDFQLADEVLFGEYRVTATMGEFKSEKSFTVKRYVLPKFKLDLGADKPFYLPQETIKAKLQADYFFGKPVSKARVIVRASTFDVEFKEFAKVVTGTDEKGHVDFEIKLPDYFVGSSLAQGNAIVQIVAEITDGADHTETSTKSLPVSQDPIRIYAVPESGKLVPGVENILYVVTASPDGAAVPATVTLKARGIDKSLKTNDLGCAKFTFTPSAADLVQSGNDVVLAVTVDAAAKDGTKASRTLNLSTQNARDNILLRLDKAIYTAGESMRLEVLGTFAKSDVFIDVIRKGQTILTTVAEMKDGRASYKLDLTPEIFGGLEIHAYKLTGLGEIVRDSKIVYVQPPQDLAVRISTDKDVYRPGDLAEIKFEVTSKGKGVASALGVIVVDESVYALQEMQPGLEKVYFTLERELATPRIEFCPGGATMTSMVGLPEVGDAQQAVGEMLFAGVEPPARRWSRNTVAERRGQLTQNLEQIYWGLYYYVVSERKEFTTVDKETGKRKFKDGLVQELAKAGRQYAIGAAALKDPWGGELTIDVLSQLDGRFTLNHFVSLYNQNHIWPLRQAIAGQLAAQDVVEWTGGAWKYRAGWVDKLVEAKALTAEYAKDGFGEPWSEATLAAMGDDFKPENVAKGLRELRLMALYNGLAAYAVEHDVFERAAGKVAGYRKGVLDELEKEKLLLTIRDEKGEKWDLAKIGKDVPALAVENMARVANAGRQNHLYRKLIEVVMKDGATIVGQFNVDALAWIYKPSAFEELVKRGDVKAECTKTAEGLPIKIEELAAKPGGQFPQVVKAALGARFNGIYNKLNQYGWQHQAEYYDGREGTFKFPAGIASKLIAEKILERAELRDPWGTQIRIDRLDKARENRWWWAMPFTELVAAGPDRLMGTADDIKDLQTLNAQWFAADMAGVVGFTPTTTWGQWYGWGWGFEGKELAEDGMFFANEMDKKPGDFRGGGRLERARDAAGMAPPPAPAGVAMTKLGVQGEAASTGGEGGGALVEPTRVREYFPETLMWEPALITDENGRATMKLEMADSITTWRLTASASTARGLLGSTTHGLRVFQDFFVDIDLPVSLTQNDSVSIPIAIYNYLSTPQTIQIELDRGDWFAVDGPSMKSIDAKPNEVKVVYFPITVRATGDFSLMVKARGTKMADAVKRSIEVVPDGKKIETVYNGQVKGGISHEIEIPDVALDGASKVFVKFYPGVFSTVMEGLDGMLHMPGG